MSAERGNNPRAALVWVGAGTGAVVAALVVLVGAGTAGGAPKPPVKGPRPGAVALTSAPAQKAILTLPFNGIWGVIQGFDSGETHVGYAAYALDFVPAEDPNVAVPEEKRRKLADYPCFGQPVLAAGDGTVVWARDGSPDRPLNKEVKGDPGNFVIVKHGEGEFTELRHLQAKSVKVKVGDQVARGQELGTCGNSGNAKTPHVHIGFLGSADPIATRPMRLSRYKVLQAGSWELGDGVLKVKQLVQSISRP